MVVPVVAALLLFPLVAQQEQPPKNGLAFAVLGLPPSSPAEVANLEQQVAADPTNLQLRRQMLGLYAGAGLFMADRYRAQRLANIQFVINEHPDDPLAGDFLTYVASNGDPYANPGDHANIADMWRAQANRRFDDAKVQLNAVRFLEIEDKQQAEELFQQALAAKPDDVDLAAHFGFFYAAGLVGADAMDGRVIAHIPEATRASWAEHCREQLEASRSLHVILGAATALPNLSMRRTGGSPEYVASVKTADALRARATTLETAGNPRSMPAEFQIFANESQTYGNGSAGQIKNVVPASSLAPASPGIRVGPAVQASLRTFGAEPVYPPLAMQAGIQGTVKLQIQIGPDGTVLSVQLVSGHPLLVAAAVDAVKTWTYKPAILNGLPRAVLTTVDVPFTR